MPAFPELIEPLTDGHVALRAYAERDIPEILIAYQDDPELHIRVGLDRPPSGAQLGRQAESAEGERLAGIQMRLAILEAGSDVCRGRLAIHTIDWDHLRCELGIWLAPQVRGRGFAQRALALAAPWLFETCGLERLTLMTEPGNASMLRTARAVGFVEEGVLHGYYRERGQRVDCTVLSLLPGDLRP